MDVTSGADRYGWEERLLGRFGTWRRLITIAALILLGGSTAYVEVGRASRPRSDPENQPGAVLSDIAVPEPLIEQAVRKQGDPLFADFRAYEEFLASHELRQGVLITRVCSEQGDFLYYAFPPLRDRDTFNLLNTLLPELVSRHPGRKVLENTRVHHVPAAQLRTRTEAVSTLQAGVFAPTAPSRNRDRLQIQEKGGAAEREGT